jgi:phosphoserine phosphatase RsbU/P
VHNADFLNLQVEKRRLDLDLTMASDVQHMLLPQVMPKLPGLDVDARYLAAQKVSGDLYDVFNLGDGRLGVAVADVSGKGISASLLMAICRTSLRQIAPRHAWPSRALSELNRAMSGDIRRGMYITIIYAVIDPAANELIVARAGHEQPLWSRREPETREFISEYIPSEGMPLGLVEPTLFDEVIADRHLKFEPGETLVLYTDGLTEAPNAEEQEFGSARLADTLRSAHKQSAKEINDAILAAVTGFTGEHELRDDYTLVTVKRV